jgi:hypothetical protein
MDHERGRVRLDDVQYNSYCAYFKIHPEVDAFADQETSKCPSFFKNAFEEDWDGCVLLVNPPFHKMGDALLKLSNSKCEAIVVCPHWTHAPWWSLMQSVHFKRQHRVDVPLYRNEDGSLVPLMRWPSVISYWSSM